LPLYGPLHLLQHLQCNSNGRNGLFNGLGMMSVFSQQFQTIAAYLAMPKAAVIGATAHPVNVQPTYQLLSKS